MRFLAQTASGTQSESKMPHSHLQSMILAARAKSHLREIGMTYRAAALELGRSYQHLSDVLNGKRESRALIARVLALKPRIQSH